MGSVTTVVVVVMAAAMSASTFAQLPDGCLDPPGNNAVADIIANALEAVRPLLVNGLPDLGIPPLDPLGPLPVIPLHIDVSNLRLDGTVNDTLVKYLSQYVVCQVNFTLGISEKLDVDLRLEDFRIEGQYDVDGTALAIFPVFGSGGYSLDVNEAQAVVAAKISYNPISDHASVKNLQIDIAFESLDLVMECILGCGDMADLINSLASEIAPAIFNAVWEVIDPILTSALEDGINEILKNVSISDIITREQIDVTDIGNANEFMDLVMSTVDALMVSDGMDPVELPKTSLNFGLGTAELYDGLVSGMSTLHRDGSATLDKVADWIFLYANVAVENLQVTYTADVTVVSQVTGVKVTATVTRAAVYLVAREDIYTHTADIDQFIITEFGEIDVKIEGLGILDYVLGPLTEAVANLVHENIANILETQVKGYIQDVLNETPWP
ncbi:uncharacterized protein [Procambarus clarkii]|uniref:uncharacterized protein n=1 Tax=Procambarus clarkii TaxID=6728 RepID=UPI001E675245|nr:uncharacterized protein LOC123767379 [Procambarus clarkii]